MALMVLAVLSGALQVLGYTLYVRLSLKREIEPNPTTWFMFAYGTALLAVLEWSRGAGWTLLVLPVVCAVLATGVALLCLKLGTLRWPNEKEDQAAFIADVLLTVGYCGAWALTVFGFVNESERATANLVFLVCSNLTTLTAFSPLLRQAWCKPNGEKALPWVVWTIAYVTLGVVTYAEHGLWTELMIYPIANAILHATVACFARRRI